MAASAGRWQRQAAIDAALKFSPTHAALAEQLREAQNTYGQTVKAGRSTARSTQNAARAAAPQISQIYQGADTAQKAGVTLVNQQLAGLPGVADQFKGDQAAEAQTQLANLSSARARDLALLTQQGVAAQAGAQFNQQQARSTLQQTIRQLFSKGQSTAGEEGLFAASEAGKLAHEAEGNEQQERASERSANTSRANAQEGSAQREAASKRSAASKGGGYVNGVKLLPGSSQTKAADQIATIRGLAGAILKEGHSRGQAIHILGEEEPSISKNVSEKDSSGKSTGVSRSVHIPGRKGYTPDALMAAALDEAQYGGVTPDTVRRLHAAGYSVKQLGVKVVSKTSANVQRGLGSTIKAATKALSGV